ncbi:MAG: gamma carbonic anhydrase family protein [Bacillota bacterium]|nr:gamma carbonic anhydrase family protein [Bacillota bacterium]
MIKAYKGILPTIDSTAFVAESADLIGDVTVEADANIWYNTVVRGDLEPIHIGEGSNVQDLCVLHTSKGFPLSIGKNVTIGHHVVLHGCTVQDNALIGMGAILLDGCIIESDVIVGAGSLVPPGKVIPSGHMAFGSPAKVVRALTPEEIEEIAFSAVKYIRNGKAHRAAEEK